ncbi:MAG: spermidine synthase [Myxococcota bacterium]|nr:spermidine synthase [Myxococcota bacterium]
MARPWRSVDRASTPDGELELRHRAPDDWLITHDGRVLMSSAASRSEEALGRLAAEAVAARPAARLLIGGLGMGCTLRAALESLGRDAQVVVAELNPVVVGWCRGPLSRVSGDALSDPRVRLFEGDVAEAVAEAAAPDAARYDAVALDLYFGPARGAAARSDPHFGWQALATTWEALADEGVLAVWSEGRDRAFVRRLERAGFCVTSERPGRGGLRHEVTLAHKTGTPGQRTDGRADQRSRARRGAMARRSRKGVG